MRSLLAAISFLTRLPVGRLAAFDSRDVARSAGWFPIVGALLGAIASFAAFLLRGHLPAAVAAVVIVLLEVLLTGALHYDGLADTADGFGGGADRESILRIMRDHSIGSYGGTALALLVALKVVAYAALVPRDLGLRAVLVTPVLGRWSALLLAATLPYARSDSTVVVAMSKDGMSKSALLWGTLTMAGILFAVQLERAWAALAVVLIATFCFGLYFRHRIAGITGDTLGANIQLSESAALIAFLWTANPQ